jgi:NAD(P)-dependent dehydrogenase (short-subunit alcohol dehydrogenase family)
MMLKDKAAVIYGAGGAIGGAVARAFAREGAQLFLAGRHLAPIEAVAKDGSRRGFEAGLRYETGEPYRRRLVPPSEPGEGA